MALMFVGKLALAAIPLITSNTSDARKAEGEHLMLSMRNRVRMYFSRFGLPPHKLTGGIEVSGAEANPDELIGRYYSVDDSVRNPAPGRGAITCQPHEARDPSGRLVFEFATSAYEVTWR